MPSTQHSLDTEKTTEERTKAIKQFALRCLARREYARQELLMKLLHKSYKPCEIHPVLDQLEERGYLCDARFADLVVRSRINACYGPFKIRVELKQKGVAEDVIAQLFNEYEVDWFELARKALEKRFSSGSIEALTQNEYAKRVRYLTNRGFNQEHISACLDSPVFT